MRWINKPPFGTPINPAHPLAVGLVRAWTLNEGQGTRFVDAVTGVVDPPTGSAYSWASTPHGHAISWPSGGSAIVDSGDWLAGRTSLTLAAVAQVTSGPGYGRIFDSTGNVILLGPQGSYTTMQACVGGTTVAFSGTPDSRSWHTYVLTWQSGSVCTLYVDRVPYTATPPSTTLSTTTVRLGNSVGGNSPLLGTLAWAGVWARCLNSAEVSALTARPWDLYRPSPGWSESEIAVHFGAFAPRFRRTLFRRSGSRGVIHG